MKSVAILFLVLNVVCFSQAVIGLAQDRTSIEGSSGPEVVDSVINLIRQTCVFPDDRQMLRRFAYFISNDGQNPDTYRAGYGGGIWQVPQNEFQSTQNNPALAQYYNEIKTQFGTDWNALSWQDLRKPIYSGLAAELILIELFGGEVPANLTKVEQQGAWFQRTFAPNNPGVAYNYTVSSNNLSKLVASGSGCGIANLDLAFIVDTSSSLSPDDFNQAKTFTSGVLAPFNVDPTAVRVAFMTFSTGFKTVFNFNQFSTKSNVIAGINSAQYIAGATDTDKALDYAATGLFSLNGGARQTSAKVIVLITDGNADRQTEAVQKAQLLKDLGVTIFVIGVGNSVDVNKLNQLASNPPCSHVQLLSNYNYLGSLTTQIQQLSCKAPVVLKPGNYSFQCQTVSNYRIPINGSETITIKPQSGTVKIYGSFLNPNPNAAFTEFQETATASAPVIIYVTGENRPLYLSVVSQGGDPNFCPAGNYYNVLVHNPNALQLPSAKKICYMSGIVRACTPLDYLMLIYRVTKPNSLPFTSPCTPGQPGFFPYPNNYHQFIYCDASGQYYVVYCQANFWYRDYSRMCVPGQPPVILTTVFPPQTTNMPIQPITPSSGNPCVGVEAFYVYPPDIHKYIHCTQWPNFGVIKDCAPHHRWEDTQKLCIYDSAVANAGVSQVMSFFTTPIPETICKLGLNDQDLYYHPYPGDVSRYIQCDQYGDAFIKQCMGRSVWDQNLLTCIPAPGLISDNQLPVVG